MTHIYPKQTGQFNIGGSLGLGINDNGQVRYFGGLGLMFGDRQRAILNVGVVLSQKKTLNDRYDIDNPFGSKALPDDLVVTPGRLGGLWGSVII